jgi:hypothetical protein
MYEPWLGWINNFLSVFLHEKRRQRRRKLCFSMGVLSADDSANIKSKSFLSELEKLRATIDKRGRDAK